ncbi:hypothetical protein [Leptolyngbya sp. 'hensonii']|uniref:hypothetical protein n=1 Tax=Leptolyngbya sp. 'hensonii' TaxID=1922337 RepID=UPI000AD56F72|nr:hypothetical protein [Leptolyngbya sp. 'hensonii']
MLLNLLPSAIVELYASTLATGKLTLADRYGLFAALMDNSLSSEEFKMIDRVLYGLRRGHIQVVDDLSTVQ